MVTTNPTHVMKSGRKPDDVYREILDIVNGPVSLETIATDAPTIVKERGPRTFAKLHPVMLSSKCRSSQRGAQGGEGTFR